MIILDYVSDSDKIQDGMLLWLEEHGHGFIKLIEEGRAKSINLFPEEPPLCSTAVTNGVQVGEYILPLMFALLSLFIQA
jgi:F-box protein 3